jgi:hypothetical protein
MENMRSILMHFDPSRRIKFRVGVAAYLVLSLQYGDRYSSLLANLWAIVAPEEQPMIEGVRFFDLL